MLIFQFALDVEGVDVFDDDETMELLAERLPHCHWSVVDGQTRLMAFIQAVEAVDAVLRVQANLRCLVPGARVVGVVEDYVSISDIAQRIGVNREAVRHWVNGTRGSGDFPRARSVVGGNVKIWDWAAVNAWLQDNFCLGDKAHVLTRREIAAVELALEDTLATHPLPTEGPTRAGVRLASMQWKCSSADWQDSEFGSITARAAVKPVQSGWLLIA